MSDIIITGASRGLGRALALHLAGLRLGRRLVLLGRDERALDALAGDLRKEGAAVEVLAVDLSDVRQAREAGERLSNLCTAGATLVHNAGVWPHARVLTPDGYETAFATNCLGPLALQEPLLARGLVDRVLVVGAGLMVKGRFDAARTPAGEDFSRFRTYATTKLCFAIAMRDVAAEHPGVDVAVVHPGVVRTALGDRPGPMGWLLSLVKRGWQAPETGAARLARMLAAPRWSPEGEATWFVEDAAQPWPAVATDEGTRAAVREVMGRALRR